MAGPGISWLFHVRIDAADVGVWTECSGLTATYEVEEFKEGGQNGFVHKLPGRLTFSNIQLKRPLDKQSGMLASWFASVPVTPVRSTASITALDSNLDPVTVWNVVDVVPVSWTGPSFTSTGSSLAVEQLELAHHGFV